MRLRRTLLLLLALSLLGATGICAGAPASVLFVLSKSDAPYTELVRAAQDGLAAQRAGAFEIAVQHIDDFSAAAVPAPMLIVAVGVEAARRVTQANPTAPILHALVPRAAATEILRAGRAGRPPNLRDSAVYLDQPLGRQLDLIRAALPRHKRVAALLGPSTQYLAAELRAAARERALTLKLASLTRREQLLPALEELLEGNDVLLSVPDPLVYNSETIHHLLLTTYRHRLPVMGLSKAYVDAGALLAVYSTPGQIGQQVAQLISALPLPAPTYPKQFVVSVNRRVAASLDLTLETDQALQRKVEALARP